jgi:small-conductance mechanosensitive channel
VKAVTVRYQRVRNLGNYENERVEVEVQVEDGETAQQVLDAAKRFVLKNLPDPMREHDVQRARKIVADPENFTMGQIKQAQDLLAQEEQADDDLPF